MKRHLLGLPRIGANRELKRALEGFWRGELKREELLKCGESIIRENISMQMDMDLITIGDFSFYDQILDMSILLGNVPKRFSSLDGLERYFAISRGFSIDGENSLPSDMRKFFNTNYHYIVPEFDCDDEFTLNFEKFDREIDISLGMGVDIERLKPVIIGPITYLWLSNIEINRGYYKKVEKIYNELLLKFKERGIKWCQIDEPLLTVDSLKQELSGLYKEFYKGDKGVNTLLATYFDSVSDNWELIDSLDVDAVHLDVTSLYGNTLGDIGFIKSKKELSVGVLNSRNPWITDYNSVISFFETQFKGNLDKIWIAPSASLHYLPVTSRDEKYSKWLSFAWERVEEINTLYKALNGEDVAKALKSNQESIESLNRYRALCKGDGLSLCDNPKRESEYSIRSKKQRESLKLPKFPTTTIGSFPQTLDIRKLRLNWKKGEINDSTYADRLKKEIRDLIKFQEEIDLDLLVHGEFERTDMVEYFAEHLEGYITTQKGWVQSYGSRCVKPGIIISDIKRETPISIDWITYAQSLTDRPVKGMLTGPVTMVKWSFVRDDIPYEEVLYQLSSVINREVLDLEKAGIKAIQIDEAALREGLPIKLSEWKSYKMSAAKAFRLSCFGVRDETQIHTHMCYSNFDDILDCIKAMDSDVITIETTRSNLSLLDKLDGYYNSLGPGVYDIHSPNIPELKEFDNLLNKALSLVPKDELWVNPDCGLKTRGWAEVRESLKRMVISAKKLRKRL